MLFARDSAFQHNRDLKNTKFLNIRDIWRAAGEAALFSPEGTLNLCAT